MTRQGKGEFTGRHMLGLMLAFFGTIIAVNLAMAIFASTSWTGFVVKNSYVASQQFNRKASEGRAQAALGFHSSLTIADGKIRYELVDAAGIRMEPEAVTVTFRRPAYEAEDWTLTLRRAGDGTFVASQTPRDGIWIAETDAEIGRERPYRDVRRVVISNGVIK
ncbi:MAG TPA: FixH family protein [Rhizobiaceae bacterium]|nr:FixH family protein [Rhizobiaceae bacterium]